GQAALNQLLAGPTREQITLAQISVLEAEAALSKTLNGATKQQLDISRASVKEAEASLAQLLAGATPEQLAAAEASVRQAQAGLDQAMEAGNRLSLTAPFGGVVTAIDLEVGQIVGAGTPVANVADLSGWVIETDDLTEIDVVKVVEGQEVSVKFDALPAEAFVGRVARIKPRSETKAGDVTYTVTIELDNYFDPRLRWGMTTFVEISTE
ncbi:MAG: efflux RND transporter periplasmic adaptor subunit, partial [Chloroflexota bacterium]